MKLVLGITGATGSIIGVRILQALGLLGVETHLVLSKRGRATLEMETDVSASDLYSMADHVYGSAQVSAPIASGSFKTDGMIIAPCSMKTLAAVRAGYGEGLIPRAADVALKERRPLVLVPRESPLSEIHLENMLAIARMGAVIAPPVLAFYNRPMTIDDIVTHITVRVLDQFGLEVPGARRWSGPGPSSKAPDSGHAKIPVDGHDRSRPADS